MFTDLRKRFPSISKLPSQLAIALCKLRYPDEPERIRYHARSREILTGRGFTAEHLDGVFSLQIFKELSFELKGQVGKISLRPFQGDQESSSVMVRSEHDKANNMDPLDLQSLSGRDSCRVWYADCEFIFKCTYENSAGSIIIPVQY